MKLYELLSGAGIAAPNITDAGDVEITAITQDTRVVKPGSVFVCIEGTRSDGHDFAEKALENGAVAVIVQRSIGVKNEVLVKNTREAYSDLCKTFWGRPDEKLVLVAVTGTNGKTTVTSVLKQVCEANGHATTLIGTVQNEIGDTHIPSKYTTPDPFELFALLSRSVKAGCRYVVMEASSQAMDQLRLHGLTFEVSVFTNLTQDHLDYHKTLENYFEAKAKLFNNSRHAILNFDDDYARIIGKRFAHEIAGFGIKSQDADCRAVDCDLSASGVSFDVVSKRSKGRCSLPMLGEFSIYNALAVIATAEVLGFDSEITLKALSQSKGVIGRSELLFAGEYSIICDYAHTSDGLDNFLSSIRPFVEGRLIVLFGCAGERDARKRPGMARAVAKYADIAVVTSDNPRGEDADSIIGDVTPTFDECKTEYITETDRRYAINRALALLEKGDVLALCGKGHEDYQVVDGVTLYLDEHRIVEEFVTGKNVKKG